MKYKVEAIIPCHFKPTIYNNKDSVTCSKDIQISENRGYNPQILWSIDIPKCQRNSMEKRTVFSTKGDGTTEQPNGKKRLIISHHIQKLTTDNGPTSKVAEQ